MGGGRRDDVGDTQDDARLAIHRRRRGGPALGQRECLLHGVLGQARRRGAARHGRRLLGLAAGLGRESFQALALGQALDKLGGDGDDLLAPLGFHGTGLDLRLHLLERLLLLRRDAEHLGPDIAAIAEVGGLRLQADGAGKRGLRDLGSLGMLDRRLAGAGLARAIRLRDLEERQLQALGDLLERLARRALALDLLVQRLDLLAGAFLRKPVPDLVLDLVVSALLARHDVRDPHQRGRELAIDRLRQLVLAQAEGHVGDLGVDHVLAREQPEIDIALLEAQLGRRLDQVGGSCQLRVGLLRRRLVGERQLHHTTLLGDVELLLVLLVGGLRLLLGDGQPRLDVGTRQQERVDLAQLGRHELALALLVVLLELGLVRLGDLDELVVVGREELDHARLVAIAMQQVDQILGRRDPGQQRVGQLLAHLVLAPRGHVAGLADTVLAQNEAEVFARELAGRVLERGIAADHVGDGLVGDRQPQLARVRIDRRRGDQTRQGALLDAQHLGLLRRQTAASQAARDRRHLLLVGLAVLIDGNLGVADARQRAPAIVAKDIGHAPQRKGDDQEAKQGLGHPVHRAASHCIEHGSFRVAAACRSKASALPGEDGRKRFFRTLTRTRGIL